ncbi:MAG: hypothetical protein GXO82_05125, partial [Chlorobi bacterium]|nr:hypothetical protein [Chlorobiota bacterium]
MDFLMYLMGWSSGTVTVRRNRPFFCQSCSKTSSTRYIRTVFVLLAWCSLLAQAQAQLVSPGKLSTFHKHLEGVKNCTKCHNFGKSSFLENCLDCHKEIRTRVKKAKGFHYYTRKIDCSRCHKEHHGRAFQLVRWDPGKFDHKQTGFVLKDKHGNLECRKCHDPKNIVQKDIRKKSAAAKKRTYLGLEPACGNCHEDEHRGQLGTKCSRCHNARGWKKTTFSHSNARFKLKGKHANVDCVKCHPWRDDGKSIAGDTKFHKFKGIAYKSCLDCHKDRHQGAFGANCAGCHSPAGWKQVRISETNFDHSKTHFTLLGKHALVPCAKCHEGGNFKTFTGKNLESCLTCHEDYHRGQFVSTPGGGECSRCHTVDGFAPSTFELLQHEQARFKLKGAHVAIPCDKCHGKAIIDGKETLRFHWENFACTTCHEDYHAGQFADKVAKDGCQACHVEDNWHVMEFDHTATAFPLLGKHVSVPCDKCHKQGVVNGKTTVLYKIENRACRACHQDYHQGQLANADGRTACRKGHTP